MSAHSPESFTRLQARFPRLQIGKVLTNAALGFQNCLDPIWRAGALRMVDIRVDRTDADPHIRLRRGCDENGHPLCLHGDKM